MERNQKDRVRRIIDSSVMKKLGVTLVVLVGIFCVSCRTADTAKYDCVRQAVAYLCSISQQDHPDDTVAVNVRESLTGFGIAAVPYLVESLSDLPRPGVPTEEPAWADKVGSLTLALHLILITPCDGLVNWLIDRVVNHHVSLAPYEDVAEVRERLLERFGYLIGVRKTDEAKRQQIRLLMSALANQTISKPAHSELADPIFVGDFCVAAPHLSVCRNAEEEFYKHLGFTPHPLVQEGGAAVPQLLEAIKRNHRPLKEILIVNSILRRWTPLEQYLCSVGRGIPQPPEAILELERMRLIDLLEACERFRASHGKK